MTRPLAGVRVADFSHVLAGPFATYFLALLGAEVIKVEPPRGDNMRRYGADPRYHGMSGQFIAANGGKRGIALDLKLPGGKDVARTLIASCDVLVENFRPGAMDRLGFSYDVVKALRPDVIYCSISGYGQSGSRRDDAAIDNIVQATSGLIDLNAGANPPQIMAFPIVDTYTATMAAMGIVAAILQRQRDGLPQHIDVAMMDSAMTLMSAAVVPFIVNGERRSAGKRGFSGSPGSGVFRARDGKLLSLGVVQDKDFRVLCKTLDRAQLADDPRFATIVTRLANAADLIEELERAFVARDAEVWERLLTGKGLAAGVVRDLASVVDQPDLHARDTLLPVTVAGLPGKEEVALVNLGFRFEHDGPGTDRPPPRHGQDGREVLAELGFTTEQQAQLIAEGAVIVP